MKPQCQKHCCVLVGGFIALYGLLIFIHPDRYFRWPAFLLSLFLMADGLYLCLRALLATDDGPWRTFRFVSMALLVTALFAYSYAITAFVIQGKATTVAWSMLTFGLTQSFVSLFYQKQLFTSTPTKLLFHNEDTVDHRSV